MRLDRFLCETNQGTRSQVKEWIKKGFVTVNGQTAKSADCKIDEETDRIALNGKILSFRRYAYYMLNKPQGVVCSTQDDRERTVLDLLQEGNKGSLPKGLFPAGRLDKDTEGLLLITNDGALAHRLLSPSRHVDKTYLVQIDGKLTEEAAAALEAGVEIGEKGPTAPARVERLTDCSLYLTITEGKFHQVKRMLHAVGREVIFLKRIAMGPLLLDPALDTGAFRELNGGELEQLGVS